MNTFSPKENKEKLPFKLDPNGVLNEHPRVHLHFHLLSHYKERLQFLANKLGINLTEQLKRFIDEKLPLETYLQLKKQSEEAKFINGR